MSIEWVLGIGVVGFFIVTVIYMVRDSIRGLIDKLNYAYGHALDTEIKAFDDDSYTMDTIRMPNVKPPKVDNNETGTMTILLKNSNSTIIIKDERETVFNNIRQLIGNPMGFEAVMGKDFVVRIADILAISFKKDKGGNE